MAFKYLDLTDATCFGYNPDRSRSWRRVAVGTIADGWSDKAAETIEGDLAKDVDASYFRICVLEFSDAETGTSWTASFVNDVGCWELQMKGENQPDALDTDKKGFFESEDFKAACSKAAEHITRAYDAYQKVVKPRLENGEMIDVDTVKLEALLWWIGQQGGFMDGFRAGKYR